MSTGLFKRTKFRCSNNANCTTKNMIDSNAILRNRN